MLVTIQKDESIRSFVERTIFLSQGEVIAKTLRKISCSSLDVVDLRRIAGLLKWPGVYGFNRLLHCHTDFPIRALLKHYNELAYSGSTYSMKHFRYDDSPASYCPDCIREDLDNKGFTYWRRLHKKPWSVCAKHNVKLIDRCPYCEETFEVGRHPLTFLWSGCNGHYASECPSSPNMDASALRAARDAQDIVDFGYHLPAQRALEVLSSRVYSLIKNNIIQDADKNSTVEINRILSYCNSYDGYRSYQSIEFADAFMQALNYGFKSFYDFVVSTGWNCSESIQINDLWSTHQFYLSLGRYAYIEEDYRTGVGIFFLSIPTAGAVYKGRNDNIELDDHKHRGHITDTCVSDGPAEDQMFNIPILGTDLVDSLAASLGLEGALECFSSKVVVGENKINSITEDEFQELESLLGKYMNI